MLPEILDYEDALEYLNVNEDSQSPFLIWAGALVGMGNRFGKRRIEEKQVIRFVNEHLAVEDRVAAQHSGFKDVPLAPLKERFEKDVRWLAGRLELDPNYPRVNQAGVWYQHNIWHNPSYIAAIMQGTGYPWITTEHARQAKQLKLAMVTAPL